MTESFNQALRAKLVERKAGISKKKHADPGELLARAEAAIGELQAVLAELAASREDAPGEEG